MPMFKVFNEKALKIAVSKNYNVIATGPSRGGTTLLGSLLHYLGFPLGGLVHDVVYEDVSFSNLAKDEELWPELLPKLIEERTAENPSWALKFPAAMRRLDFFEKSVPNPVFFVMVRNPLLVIESLIKYDDAYSGNVNSYCLGYKHFKYYFDPFFNVLGRLVSPVVLCNYEQVLSDVPAFIRGFCSILEIDIDETRVSEITKELHLSKVKYRKKFSTA